MLEINFSRESYKRVRNATVSYEQHFDGNSSGWEVKYTRKTDKLCKMTQKFVTSVSTEFDEPVITSNGSEDAGKIVALDNNGKIDPSLLPTQAILPPGVIQYFAIQSAPEGWLKADGSEVSRIDYVSLFEVIGVTFGAGDGSTTFNLPDLRGEFVRGFDDGRGVDLDRVLGSLQSGQNEIHDHALLSNQSSSIQYPLPEHQNNDGVYKGTFPEVIVKTGQMVTPVCAVSLQGGGKEARPRNIALLACIKY